MTYSTAYPFRVPINDMMCVYCGDSFEDPGVYRRHMRDDHSKFNIQTGVSHVHNNCNEFIKVDCTELMCRICDMEFKSIDSIAEHLVEKHDKNMVLSAGLGLQVFKLGEELWTCAFCGSKFPCLRALSRHTSVHYHRYTCETCGRSYMNKENLQRHVIFGHSKEKVCMRCRKLFPNCEARRKHVLESPKCWHYLCGYCGQRFINTQLKTQHLIEVHKEERKTHTCPNCGEIFQKWNLYRTHFVTVHTSNYYACPYCELKFDTKRRLNEHKVLHTQEKNYVCPVCSKTFARKKSLAQHSWLHKEEKRFECIPCNKKFNQKVSWRTHMKSYHPGEYHESDSNVIARRNAEIIVKYSTAYPFRLPEDTMVCVYCAESYDTSTAYRTHMDTEHQTFKIKMAFGHCGEGYLKADCTILRCRLCSESVETIEDIAQHLYDVHRQPLSLNTDLGIQPFRLEKDKYLCAICNAKSLCLRQLSRHTQTHFLKYTCDACGKSYATMTTLKHHIRFSHIDNQRICRKCRTTFSSLEAKRKHLKESPKCWPHLCNVCGERFVTWNIKQTHMNQVHGTQRRTYVCPECHIVFSDRKKYRAHFIITHTDKNFMCSCCGLKFETKRDLDDHRVVHTKERLFPCPVCSKSFPRKKNLAQHMWIHSEHKRFECTLCNKQFNQRVSWRTHMKSYHPEIYIPPYQSTSAYEGWNNNRIMVSLKTD